MWNPCNYCSNAPEEFGCDDCLLDKNTRRVTELEEELKQGKKIKHALNAARVEGEEGFAAWLSTQEFKLEFEGGGVARGKMPGAALLGQYRKERDK